MNRSGIAIVGLLSVGACKSKTVEHKPDQSAAAIDLGVAAHPFGLVKDIWPGMTMDEMATHAPSLQPMGHGGYSAIEKHATYLVEVQDGRVESIEIQLHERAAQDLAKAWGEGRDLSTIDHPEDGSASTTQVVRRYFDAARGTLADVVMFSADSFSVRIEGFVPLAKVLDGPDATWVYGVNVLGRPVKDVAADFRARHVHYGLGSSTRLELPATEWTGEHLHTRIDLEASPDGKVKSWSLASTGLKPTAEAIAATRAAYEHRWGKPKDEGGFATYGHHPLIRVTDPQTQRLRVDAE